MSKFFGVLFCYICIFLLGLVSMQYGWGAEIKSLATIIGCWIGSMICVVLSQAIISE